ncbi:MAG TPA: flap endonuclease-1 [Candidatus Nanoarchaeia archaeon]|nr:flap endonuclease-1 [Candidatus Nanoarchaeia archaeon]
MGVKLKDLAVSKQITLDELHGKILAVDAFNTIYQFLTTIVQRDGKPLVNHDGHVTSHLNGLFYRCTKFMEHGLKLVFVFDGKPPALKSHEIARRVELKMDAAQKHKEAEEKGDIEGMKKYAVRTARLTTEMIEESKQLLALLGIPIIQAPSEGEAQAAYMTKQGDAYAVVSQDFDSLLFGCTRVVRNLSIDGRRKKAGTLLYTTVQPELITLSDVLNTHGIDQDKLIALGMLVGTDFNNGGIPGIGPKKALKLVTKHNELAAVFEEAQWKKYWDIDWKEIFDTIKHMPCEKKYTLQWKAPQIEKLRAMLVEQCDFSPERIDVKLKKFVEERKEKAQTGLEKWT